MRKFMVVLPCLLLVHGIAAANETSSRNDRRIETSTVLTAAFESARTVERPSLLPAPAGGELQFAAKKRRKAAATPAKVEVKSNKPSDRFYMTQNGKKMTAAGFDIRPGAHPISPVMLYDAPLAQRFAERLLEEGIYAIGFFFPVVARGQARIRTQISAAHTREHLDRAIAAFVKIGNELGVIKT